MQTASLKQFDADAAETKPLSSIVEASLYVAARPARNQHRFCPAVKLRKSAAKPARRRRRARPGNAPHNSLCGNSTTMYCSAGICVLKKETNGKVRLNDEKKNDCRPDRLRPDRFHAGRLLLRRRKRFFLHFLRVFAGFLEAGSFRGRVFRKAGGFQG